MALTLYRDPSKPLCDLCLTDVSHMYRTVDEEAGIVTYHIYCHGDVDKQSLPIELVNDAIVMGATTFLPKPMRKAEREKLLASYLDILANFQSNLIQLRRAGNRDMIESMEGQISMTRKRIRQLERHMDDPDPVELVEQTYRLEGPKEG